MKFDVGRVENIVGKEKMLVRINVTQKLKFDMGRVENNVGKGENAGYQHFLFFPQHLKKGLFLRVDKSQDCVVKG